MKVTIYKYGDIPVSQVIEKLKRDRKFVCPKCKGKGRIQVIVDSGHPNMDKLHRSPTYGAEDCDLCQRYGYTETLKKLIVRVEKTVMGYE